MNEPAGEPEVISNLSARAARTLAVEILLSNTEWLADDVLESCLYLLQDRLAGAPRDTAGNNCTQ